MAQRFSPSIKQVADSIQRKFSVAFELFQKCHRIYDKCHVSESEINSLGKHMPFMTLKIPHIFVILSHVEQNIASFIKFYKESFPEATVTPKFHMLEKHVVTWLRAWPGVGFGLMGEQGAESIHAYFNSLKRTYQTIPNSVDRLHCIMKERYIHVAPADIAALPPIKKRKKSSS